MLEIIALDQLPMLSKGDDLAAIIVARARSLGVGIRSRDVIVVGQKAVSKVEGRVVDIRNVRPSETATRIAKRTGKSPELVQVVVRESPRIVRADEEALIVTTKKGATCLNAGVDKSNVKGEYMYALLPKDPDASARLLMKRVRLLTGKHVGVVVSDTRSRPFRRGQVEECIGIAGLGPLIDYRGQKDLFGYTLHFKNIALADELASAAELVMGQGREASPAAIIRGLKRVRFEERASSKSLTVLPADDLFRGTL
jgi:coenzyme F420-0:L-glutamate ligase / coenzyme F420-1:gamma-L-glutamate ligase